MSGNNGTTLVAEQPKTAVAVAEKNIADNVLARVHELEKTGGLQIPAKYSAANALKSAWLMLQTAETTDKRPVLEACTKTSIANALLDMVVQGLSPAKKQCYFIPYGRELQLSRSYMGTVAVTKSLTGVKDVFANLIYEGDVFEYDFDLETGGRRIIKHEQPFENVDVTKIKGAYCIITRKDAAPFVEIMNMKQIRAAWEQGKAKGDSPAHKKFPDEMAKKSVINRACKMFWNTSDDSDLLIEAINKTTDVEDLPNTPYTVLDEVEKEVAAEANKQLIDIQPEPVDVEPEFTPEDWENLDKVIAKFGAIKDLQEFRETKAKNIQKLDSFGGPDADMLFDAIRVMEEKLTPKQSTKNSKKAPF